MNSRTKTTIEIMNHNGLLGAHVEAADAGPKCRHRIDFRVGWVETLPELSRLVEEKWTEVAETLPDMDLTKPKAEWKKLLAQAKAGQKQ